MRQKNYKWTATTTGELGQPIHDGDDQPLFYDSPDAAFFAGQGMNGVSMWNDAFVVRPLSIHDIPDEEDWTDEERERYQDIDIVNSDDDLDYPVYVGHNGAKWVREWYQKILFEILSPKPDWKRIQQCVGYLPALDPERIPLQQLLEDYRDRNP